jgi:hypothetical protein
VESGFIAQENLKQMAVVNIQRRSWGSIKDRRHFGQLRCCQLLNDTYGVAYGSDIMTTMKSALSVYVTACNRTRILTSYGKVKAIEESDTKNLIFVQVA